MATSSSLRSSGLYISERSRQYAAQVHRLRESVQIHERSNKETPLGADQLAQTSQNADESDDSEAFDEKLIQQQRRNARAAAEQAMKEARAEQSIVDTELTAAAEPHTRASLTRVYHTLKHVSQSGAGSHHPVPIKLTKSLYSGLAPTPLQPSLNRLTNRLLNAQSPSVPSPQLPGDEHLLQRRRLYPLKPLTQVTAPAPVKQQRKIRQKSVPRARKKANARLARRRSAEAAAAAERSLAEAIAKTYTRVLTHSASKTDNRSSGRPVLAPNASRSLLFSDSELLEEIRREAEQASAITRSTQPNSMELETSNGDGCPTTPAAHTTATADQGEAQSVEHSKVGGEVRDVWSGLLGGTHIPPLPFHSAHQEGGGAAAKRLAEVQAHLGEGRSDSPPPLTLLESNATAHSPQPTTAAGEERVAGVEGSEGGMGGDYSAYGYTDDSGQWQWHSVEAYNAYYGITEETGEYEGYETSAEYSSYRGPGKHDDVRVGEYYDVWYKADEKYYPALVLGKKTKKFLGLSYAVYTVAWAGFGDVADVTVELLQTLSEASVQWLAQLGGDELREWREEWERRYSEALSRAENRGKVTADDVREAQSTATSPIASRVLQRSESTKSMHSSAHLSPLHRRSRLHVHITDTHNVAPLTDTLAQSELQHSTDLVLSQRTEDVTDSASRVSHEHTSSHISSASEEEDEMAPVAPLKRAHTHRSPQTLVNRSPSHIRRSQSSADVPSQCTPRTPSHTPVVACTESVALTTVQQHPTAASTLSVHTGASEESIDEGCVLGASMQGERRSGTELPSSTFIMEHDTRARAFNPDPRAQRTETSEAIAIAIHAHKLGEDQGVVTLTRRSSAVHAAAAEILRAHGSSGLPAQGEGRERSEGSSDGVIVCLQRRQRVSKAYAHVLRYTPTHTTAHSGHASRAHTTDSDSDSEADERRVLPVLHRRVHLTDSELLYLGCHKRMQRGCEWMRPWDVLPQSSYVQQYYEDMFTPLDARVCTDVVPTPLYEQLQWLQPDAGTHRDAESRSSQTRARRADTGGDSHDDPSAYTSAPFLSCAIFCGVVPVYATGGVPPAPSDPGSTPPHPHNVCIPTARASFDRRHSDDDTHTAMCVTVSVMSAHVYKAVHERDMPPHTLITRHTLRQMYGSGGRVGSSHWVSGEQLVREGARRASQMNMGPLSPNSQRSSSANSKRANRRASMQMRMMRIIGTSTSLRALTTAVAGQTATLTSSQVTTALHQSQIDNTCPLVFTIAATCVSSGETFVAAVEEACLTGIAARNLREIASREGGESVGKLIAHVCALRSAWDSSDATQVDQEGRILLRHTRGVSYALHLR